MHRYATFLCRPSWPPPRSDAGWNVDAHEMRAVGLTVHAQLILATVVFKVLGETQTALRHVGGKTTSADVFREANSAFFCRVTRIVKDNLKSFLTIRVLRKKDEFRGKSIGMTWIIRPLREAFSESIKTARYQLSESEYLLQIINLGGIIWQVLACEWTDWNNFVDLLLNCSVCKVCSFMCHVIPLP